MRGADGGNGDGARPIIFERLSSGAGDDYAREDGRVDWRQFISAHFSVRRRIVSFGPR